MPDFVDRDELRALIEQHRERWMDRGYTGAQLLDIIHTLDAMPTPTCETCRRGDDDQGKDQCRGPLLREASMCNFWEARP